MTLALGERRPMFTVFTPCYNSEACIDRVWASLTSQTLRDFEWIAIDDASTDGTWAKLQEFQRQADFPVRVLRNSRNLGQGPTMNRAVAEARGTLFLPIGHDDAFVPEALERFRSWWESIPPGQRPRFSGVTARCMDPSGQPLDDPFPHAYVDSDSVEMDFIHRRRKEKWGFTRLDLLRQHPFPELDRYIPEGVIWRTLAQTYKTRYVNDVLRVYFRDNPESMSQTKRVRYPRGIAYACAVLTNLEWRHFWKAPWMFCQRLVDYTHYGLEARVPVRRLLAHLRPWSARALAALALPVGAALARRDARQGRIVPGIRTGDWDADSADSASA